MEQFNFRRLNYLLFLLTALHFTALPAQTTFIDETPPAGYVTPAHVFQHLNLSQVPSGLLTDRALPLTNLRYFNGQMPDSAWTNPLRCQLIYATLAGAVVNANAPQLPASALGRPAATLDAGNPIPLKILFYNYHRLREDAITAGLLSISNNQLHHVPNSPASPYQPAQVLAAAPWVSVPFLQGKTYTFVPELLTNAGTDVQAMYLNVGNGFVSIAPGQPVSITFSNAGDQLMTLELQLANGNKLLNTIRATVTEQISSLVTGPETVNQYCIGQRFTIFLNDLPPNPADGERDLLTIESSCCDQTVRKPLLVINGFEAPLLTVFFGTTFTTIKNSLSFLSATGTSLLNELESAGYDLIFLDFRDETESLEHNAQVVKEAIRRINQMKAAAGSAEQNVVIGVSMGGVVGKLALLEMEAAGEAHETRLFMSHDSPLRGANIPLGFQHMVRHFQEMEINLGPVSANLGIFVSILSDAMATVNSPSPRQMLIHHHDGIVTNHYRNFYQSLLDMGELQHCEHLAVSNGSQLGIGQGFQAGDKLFSANGSAGAFLNQFTEVNDFWADFIDVAGNLLLGTGGHADIDFFAVPPPDFGQKRIYRGLVGFQLFSIPVIFSLRDVKVQGTLPLDNAPGGFTSWGLEIEDGAARFLVDQFCFIPSVSALEVGPFLAANQPLTDPFANISDNVAVLALSQTKMQNMVAVDNQSGLPSQSNQEHVDFSFDNSGVLLSYMLEGMALPPVITAQTFNHGDSKLVFDYQATPAPAFAIGRTRDDIDQDLDVSGNGRLWINRVDRIGFTNDVNNPFNAVQTQLDVNITSGFCDGLPTTVSFFNGGELEAGDWNNGQNTGRLHVRSQATLRIGSGGNAYINHQSTLIVENGGLLRVENGGLMEARFGGRITVASGGTVLVKTGGVLRIGQDSQIDIEPGGKLIIEQGAYIQLWDGPLPDGRAVVKVRGVLEIQGEFNFTGNGYFQFHKEHKLSLTGGLFRLKGMGKDFRFIELLSQVQLNIAGNQLSLEDGKVVYNAYSSMRVGTNGQAILKNLWLNADEIDNGSVGLLFEGGSRLSVTSSDFAGLTIGLEVYDFSAPVVFAYGLVTGSSFSDCITGIQAGNSDILHISQCVFSPGSAGIYAMIFDLVGSIRLNHSKVIGYSDPDPSFETLPDWGAILLMDVPEFVVNGGEIGNNDVGIYSPDYVGGVLNRANVFLRNQATVSNNGYGILMKKGGIDLNGVDYGMVMMDCARLINNTLGVKGEDVLLRIDAIENSGTSNPVYLRSNYFQNGPGGYLFDICYQQRNDIFSVDAKGNYWGTHNGNIGQNISSLHRLRNSSIPGAGCASHFPNVTLNPAFNVVNEPTSCPSLPPAIGGGISAGEYCGLTTPGVQTSVHEDYQTAYSAFVTQLDNNELTTISKQLFTEIAAISDPVRASASEKCKGYVDVARIMVDAEQIKPNLGNQPFAAVPGDYTDHAIRTNNYDGSTNSVKVFPNPASGEFFIELGETEQEVTVLDVLSRAVFKSKQCCTARINTADWEPGIYLVVVKSVDKKTINRSKVILH